MFHINRIIERISSMDGKIGRDVIIPINEARMLRDELKKLLEKTSERIEPTDTVLTVVVKGQKW